MTSKYGASCKKPPALEVLLTRVLSVLFFGKCAAYEVVDHFKSEVQIEVHKD